MKTSTKVSKKLKLSKAKVNYRKDERRAIHRRERRLGKVAFGSEQDERDHLNSLHYRYYAANR